MKSRKIVGISATALVCSMVFTQAFTAAGMSLPTVNAPGAVGLQLSETNRLPGERPEGMPEGMSGRPGGFNKELTEDEKAQMEAERAEREEKLNSFVQSLTDEQKALYEAMTPAIPAMPSEGQKMAGIDETTMAAMKEKQDAFIASLTETQKAVYDELFTKSGFQNEEKINAFIATLTDAQKEAFNELRTNQSGIGRQNAKLDESSLTAMKEKQDAFIASLSETQKAAYEELFSRPVSSPINVANPKI